MKKLNRVGEKFTTNEGYGVKIVEYFNNTNCTIQFKNGTIIKNREYKDIKKGNVKNLIHKSVYNVGFTGTGRYSYKTHSKIYITWQSMLQRCYDGKYQQKYPTYKECTVCDDWHNLQVFAEWFEENYKENCALDKDVLLKGNKIYNPENCTFIPQEINKLFIKSNQARGLIQLPKNLTNLYKFILWHGF
jgi:hypothetical protein